MAAETAGREHGRANSSTPSVTDIGGGLAGAAGGEFRGRRSDGGDGYPAPFGIKGFFGPSGGRRSGLRDAPVDRPPGPDVPPDPQPLRPPPAPPPPTPSAPT